MKNENCYLLELLLPIIFSIFQAKYALIMGNYFQSQKRQQKIQGVSKIASSSPRKNQSEILKCRQK